MSSNRIGFIGCGHIAEFHATAFKKAGFEITAVSARPGSQRIQPFAERHGIASIFDSPTEMFVAKDLYDCLLIAVNIEKTLGLLDQALQLNIPILVEKPVSFYSEELKPFLGRDLPVIVGYNRRFYKSVRKAQLEVRNNGEPIMAHLAIPESISHPEKLEDDPKYLMPFYANSVHGLDLTRYIFGNLKLSSANRLTTKEGVLLGVTATLVTSRGDQIQYTGNWSAPANFSLSLDRPGRRFDLRPFEMATVYEGFSVEDPTTEKPIRTYNPKVISRILPYEMDLKFKPGFVSQAKALEDLLNGKDHSPAARLEDAYEALLLAELISGCTYPKN